MIDRQRLAQLRRQNLLQSALVLAAMGLLTAGLGWLLAGIDGILWGLGAGLVALLLQPGLSWPLLQRLYRARPLRPEEAPGLYQIIRELADRAGISAPPALFYIPSPVIQAVTVGRGGEAAVGITDGLLRLLSRRELASVLAHEISHIRHRDLWLMQLAGAAARLTDLFSTLGLVLIFLYLPLVLVGEIAIPLSLVLVLLFAPMVSALLQLTLARTREFAADASAVELTGDARGLISALDKLERLQGGLWEGFSQRPRGPLARLLRTHPETAERIARLEALEPARPAPAIALPELVFHPFEHALRRTPFWLGWFQRYWY
jgi:heat shock protein HtpX